MSEKSHSKNIVEELNDSRIIQKLRRHYPIAIFLAGDCWNLRIQLKDLNGKLVELFDIPMNSDGFVHVETAIHFIVLAWEVALYDRDLRHTARRMRKNVRY